MTDYQDMKSLRDKVAECLENHQGWQVYLDDETINLVIHNDKLGFCISPDMMDDGIDPIAHTEKMIGRAEE